MGSNTIVRETGRGGMGVVYLGRDTKLDRSVAVKSLPPDLIGGGGDTGITDFLALLGAWGLC